MMDTQSQVAVIINDVIRGDVELLVLAGGTGRRSCIKEKVLLLLRLQTGMRGAFGKPLGTVARVNIGQVIMSVRTKAQNKEHVVEALRRAKFKFPGRQKVK